MIIDDDRIETVTELRAPVSRVWRALTDYVEFGQWFKVKLDQPFAPGGRSTGHMLEPGWEQVPWLATVERMEPERLFTFRWHDYDSQSSLPPEDQPTSLVEFRLEPIPGGTRLTITESGFSTFPEPRRLEAMRSNTQGWDIQAGRIAGHVAG